MNIRLHSIKIVSILSLLSVSASYPMYRTWTDVSGVPAYIQLGITGLSMAMLAYNAYMPSKKQVNWADENGNALNQVQRFSKSKNALEENISVNTRTEENKLSFAPQMHKADLAQSKRKPSGRMSRVKSAPATQEQIRQLDAILEDLTAHQAQIAIERSTETTMRAQEQMSDTQRLVKEAQALRAAMEARKAEKADKRKAVNFHNPTKQ